MQNIILEGKEVEGIVFDLADLAEHLGQLNDPRDNRGKVYPLGIVLSMIVLARLSGQDKPKGIFEWLRYRRGGLQPSLKAEGGANALFEHDPDHPE